jgi:hypothetical protein
MYAKNVILKEILKILRNQFAVHDTMFYLSKQFLSQFAHKKSIENIPQIDMRYM